MTSPVIPRIPGAALPSEMMPADEAVGRLDTPRGGGLVEMCEKPPDDRPPGRRLGHITAGVVGCICITLQFGASQARLCL